MTEQELRQIDAYYQAATQGPVTVIQLPEDQSPLDWLRECREKNIQKAVYGLAKHTENIEEEATVLAITGNGPTSLQNAHFYALAHEAIPSLIQEIRALREDNSAMYSLIEDLHFQLNQGKSTA